MKRSDDSRLIKIPDANAVASVSGSNNTTGSPLSIGQIGNSAATIFQSRPPILEMSQQTVSVSLSGGHSAVGGNMGQHIPLQAHRSGVTVFRGEPSTAAAVISPAVPPTAHTGVVVSASPSAVQQSQSVPVSLHGGPQTIMTQQTLKTVEPISLPTAPVSLQYANTFPGGASMTASSGPPASVKTLVSSGALGPMVQNLVHNLPQKPEPQQLTTVTGHQVVHPKPQNHTNVNLGNAATLRQLSSGPHLNVPNITPTTLSGNNNAVINNTNNAAANNSTNFQRLKVEDALSYLDQVKLKFGNQPQVYNDFLDIMKEFKSQSIDTPGVIARVSSLFRGHPELIFGFNTFLPPGYKIEVHSNDSIAVSIPGTMGATVQTIVHTPHGIHKMTTHGSGPLTSITTSNTGAIIPVTTMHQQQQQQQQPPQHLTQQPNVLRLPLATAPQNVPVTSISMAKFQPQQSPQHLQQQHEVKLETGSHISSAPHLPNSAFYPSASALPLANAPQNIVRQQMHQLQHPAIQQPALPGGSVTATPVASAQPVEFNHAINYVNKIKNRFQGQPDVYKQFLEILHTYQKDQKAIKEGQRPSGAFLTEGEVYAQVAKLFQNQEDLLAEFGQFLPEATGEGSMSKTLNNDHSSALKKAGLPLGGSNLRFGSPKFGSGSVPGLPSPGLLGSAIGASGVPSIKRPMSGVSHPPPKKQKTGVLRDISLAEAGKYGTLNEYAFFDKVRKALRSPEVYDNFLRCLVLFNQEVISRAELVQLTTPFLSRHPELFKWFKDFVGFREGAITLPGPGSGPSGDHEVHRRPGEDFGRLDSDRSARDRVTADSAMEIDYATCKRLGASYCALPKNFVLPSCSGRTPLCREVLNDTWVSFPSWSEDSQFVSSRKTQYEEAIYRTEDERFEFDVVLETNKDTIKVLECVQKKMSRMPPEEAARYRLDDCLGGTSATIHQRAIRRIYGDKSADIIEGLKRNPVVAVPLVLRRLRAKDEEWREVQKNFNKIWREQNEKYYLKSLDHQSLMFKQSDIRNLRSKSLLSEIETLFDERHEQNEDAESANNHPPAQEGPHLTFTYQDFTILDDANNLLIHHVKRQTSIHKEDKHKIKVLLRQFLMDRFKHARQDMSDDEREEDEAAESGKDEAEGGDSESGSKSTRSERAAKKKKDELGLIGKNGGSGKSGKSDDKDSKEKEVTEADVKVESKDGRRTPLHARDMEPDETYTMLMANNNWYLFFRLHHILCTRLTKMYNQALIIAAEETKDKKDRKDSTAVALRLKPNNEIEPEDYYPAFLDMVKNLLDGNMDAQTYEDTLREMFGIHAYISFTLDKVVGNAVRQLQHLVTDESCVECYDLFLSESKSGGTGGPCGSAAERQIAELIYQKKAEKLLADENCMKIILYHQSGSMTFELLDTETEGHDSEKDEEASRKYQTYIDQFIGPNNTISEECRAHLLSKPVFLPRSVRSFNTRSRARHLPIPPTTVTATGKNAASEGNSDVAAGNERVGVKPDPDSKDVVYEDNLQCQFNVKTNKILYIVNSENCFYRKLALRRASQSHKTVSLRKFNAFSRWHAGWIRANVTEAGNASIDAWFMGKTDDLVANRTQKISRTSVDKTPYRLHHKFVVQLIKNSHSPMTSSPAVTST